MEQEDIELIRRIFAWDKDKNAFAAVPADVMSLPSAEMKRLIELRKMGILKASGALGFILSKDCEKEFYSAKEVRSDPKSANSKRLRNDLAAIENAVSDIVLLSNAVSVSGSLDAVMELVKAVSKSGKELKAVFDSLPRLAKGSGARFELKAKDCPAVLAYSVEIDADGKAKMRISWGEDERECSRGILAVLIGRKMAFNAEFEG